MGWVRVDRRPCRRRVACFSLVPMSCLMLLLAQAAAMQDAADDAVEEGIRKQLTSSTAADKLDSTGLNLKSAWCAFTMATPPLEAMDFIKLKIRPPGKPEFVLDPDRSIDLKVYFFGDGDDGQTTTVALPSLEPLNRAFEGGLTAHYRDAAELALGLTAVRKGYISMNSGEVTAISSTPPPTPLPLVTDAAAAASGSTSGVGTRRTISSSGGGASGSSNGEGAHDTCSSSGGGASGSSSGGGASASSSGGGGSSVGGTPPMLVPNVDDPTLAAEIMPVGQKSVADA